MTVRNTASKDKKVRLARAWHTPTVTYMEYEGYGLTMSCSHTKGEKGWRVDNAGEGNSTYKKSAAIERVAMLLRLGADL
jgi:hypothetical protein